MRTKTVLCVFALLMFLSFSCSTGTGDSSPKTAKNIIFMIGDGMGLNHMYAAMTANGGSLALEEITHVGLQKTYSLDNYITDSGASGTAMACGVKTNNGAIGVDGNKNEIESVLKVAERHGLATGLVATSTITHATPASFIANDSSRGNYEAIADDFLKTDIDVFIGGGLNHFAQREDGRDLTMELEEKGYTIARSVEEFSSVSTGKLAALISDDATSHANQDRGEMLTISVKKALEILSQDEDGFFLMVEGSQIDWGSHANDQEYTVTETLDFDHAIAAALDFAREDGETLVVITGDHETGGMIVLEGNPEESTVEVTFTSGGHTGQPIPVYSYGPDAELFTGIYENTEFKGKFEKAWGFIE
jgi:alkaline phosphatase